MKENILPLEASSPEELNAKINVLSKNAKAMAARFVALAVSGPQILVRPFDLANVPLKEVKNRLKFDAVELLSLPAEEIEFDFQILNSTPDKISGVFACSPKKLLRSYLLVLDKARLIPLKATTHILATLDALFQKHKEASNQRLCLLDFSQPNVIKLAVFHHLQCELLREISYETRGEAEMEVMQSLRSACARSSVKQLDHVYFCGEVAGKEELIAQVERDFNIKIEHEPFLDSKTVLCSENNFFSLNVMRNYSLSLSERKQILMVINVILLLCLLGFIGLTLKVKQAEKFISDLKSSYTAADLDYARRLERQLKFL